MKVIDPRLAAEHAVARQPERPAMAILLDTADVRIIVFRIEPGQQVAPHTSTSSVILSVMEGAGIISGPDGEERCGPGTVIAYAPEELHGMRALGERFIVMATIAPRPGAR